MKNINFRYYVPGVLVSTIFIISALLIAAKTWASDHLGVSLAVTSLPLLFLFIIDQWLWHITPFKFLLWIPDMRGTYDGEIQYENELGKSGKLKCRLIIRQTGSVVSVESNFFDQDGNLSSSSRSEVANIIKRPDKTHQLIFTYRNEGNNHLDDHRGTNSLEFREDKKIGKNLQGQYYNSKRNKGKITVTTKH